MILRIRHPLAALLAAALAFLAISPAPAKSFIRTQLADGFDFPVGKPDAFGYYRYRGFRPNYHMGEDWNGLGGGNSDLGKPVYSVAHGVVVYSNDYKSNWGNVIIVRHAYRHEGRIQYVDSLYGHLHKRFVNTHDPIRKGQKIGTIGSNRGMYTAHLHFEMRKNINVGLVHRRYARDYSNYYNPSSFIDEHRTLSFEFEPHPIPVDCFHSGVKNRYYGSRIAALPESPLGKPAPPPRINPEVKAILRKHSLLPAPAPEEAEETEANPAEATERAKIRDFWSSSKHRIQSMMDPEKHTLGHD